MSEARDTQPWPYVVDGHNDLLWEARTRAGYDWAAMRLAEGNDSVHTDIPRLRRGGVGAQFWSVYVPGDLPGDAAVTATLEQVDAVAGMIAAHPDVFAAARTADDVDRVVAGGRIACLMGAEGGQSIGCSLGALRALFALGVRYLTLTHNHHVPWADSATAPPRLGGLSAFGREVVAEMNRLGMIVDLSHTSPGTMRDALAVAEAPAIFSHSGAAAVCAHPRNVPDDVLARLAAGGGVCAVTFVPSFLSPAVDAWEADVRQRVDAAGVALDGAAAVDAFAAAAGLPRPRVGIDDVVAHLEHVRDVAGVAAVGVGGDFDGTWLLPDGLPDVGAYPRLWDALARRGWSRADLRAAAGGNLLRVLRDAADVGVYLSARRGPSLATWAGLDGAG